MKLDQIQTVRSEHKPFRVIVVGPDKIGKSTFAASAPAPVGILTEEGLDNIEVPAFPVCTTLREVYGCVATLIKEEHPYKSMFLDSVDWLEPLVWSSVCEKNNWEHIDQAGYGKGYAAALQEWRRLIVGLQGLRNKGMNVILLSHHKQRKVESPLYPEPYDSVSLKIHEKAGSLLCEWADIIGYLDMKVSLTETSTEGKSRAVSSGARIMRVAAAPSHCGGNRFGMKDFALPAVNGWGALVDAVTKKGN